MAKLFFIGDSITAGAWDRQGGWANRLIARIMQENIDRPDFYCVPHNLGVSGYTFSDMLGRFEQEIRSREYANDPDEVLQILVSLGVNDSCYLVEEDRPRFSDLDFKANIEAFWTKAQLFTHHVSFIGLPPVDEEKVNPIPWGPDEAWMNDRVFKYEQMIEQFCSEKKLRFLPMFKRWKALPHYKELLDDGVHPNSEGHALMAKEIEAFLLTEEFYKLHKDNGV